MSRSRADDPLAGAIIPQFEQYRTEIEGGWKFSTFFCAGHKFWYCRVYDPSGDTALIDWGYVSRDRAAAVALSFIREARAK